MLTDNLIFLRRNYPKLLENMEAVEFSKDIELEKTRSGDKTLRIKDKDSYIYLHSKYNPKREAEAIIDKFEEIEEIDDDSHVVFYGAGLGYHIEIFKKRHPGVKYSIYEPSPKILDEFLKNKSLNELGLSSLCNLDCEFNERSRYLFFDKLLKNKNERLVFLELPIYQRIFAEEYKEFFESFRKRVRSERTSLHTNYSFQKRWIINSMVNLKEVLKTPNILLEGKDKFKAKPAILVAAGPSLNEEIENIRYIKENGLAYIFSVGSAINTLIHHDIYPHAATTYDPTERNQIVFEKTKEKNIGDIPMIFGTSVGYETLENYPGEKYHMMTSQDPISNYFLKDEDGQAINIVQDAPSIAVVTLQLLYNLGFNNIILVGQNLSYKGKAKHSEGIDYSGELTEEEKENGIWIKDVYGKEVLTNEGFNSMRQQMELYINNFPNLNVINTTKGGAKIEGAKFIELKEVIEEKLKDEVVEKDWLESSQTNYDKEHLKSKYRRMNIQYRNAKRTTEKYKKVLDNIDRLITSRNYPQAEKQYVNLNEELRKLENNEFYKSIVLPMNRVEYKILADSIDYLNSINNPQKKGQEIIKTFKNFIEKAESDIEDIQEIFEKMNEDIEEYIEVKDGRR